MKKTLKSSPRLVQSIALTGIISLALVACASPVSPETGGDNNGETSAQPEVEQDPDGALVVWVDSTRQPIAEAYAAAHPDVNVEIETYDGNANGATTLQTKISLFNRAGDGWPDVVFSTQPTEISWMNQEQYDFPLNLTDELSSEVIDGFGSTLTPCIQDDEVFCLRHDVAQNVVWYDTELFEEFGYEVPTTWEEYAALGDKVAEEHPGYIIGTIGDSWGTDTYLWPAECSANENAGVNTVKIDLDSENCTRMIELLDPLIANGSISKDSVFSASFATDQADKILMLVGPAWYGYALFRDGIGYDEGRIAVVDPLTWEDGSGSTGNVGGGLWIASKHTTVKEQALDFLTWAATSSEAQALNTGYPAYGPAAEEWVSDVEESGYFAGNITTALANAADLVWDGWAFTSYSWYSPWSDKVVTGLNEGKSLAELMPEFETEMQNQAKAAGYDVVE